MPHRLVLACAFVAGLTALSHAAPPVAVGKRALLTLNIQIEGAGARVDKKEGVDIQWSTKRVLDAKIEMVAMKPQTMSAAAGAPADLTALAKEAEKCKPEDTACQMAVAMKMMAAQGGGAGATTPRYQAWKAAAKGSRLEVTADYQEQWDGVFLTGARETRTCRAVFKGSTTNPATSAKDRESLRTGLDGLNLEVDTETGKSSMMQTFGSYVTGEKKCRINDAGRVFDENETSSLTFFPPLDTKANGGWLAGGVATAPAISRGELNHTTKTDSQTMAGLMSVTTPLKVKIRWEMVPL
jgi:hypothetical protein